MREKFEMNGDYTELIITYPGGDILRAPLATLLSMTTLNDAELLRFSYQPPAPDPFDAESPLPDRVHCTVKVEVTPEPHVAQVLALVEDEDQTVQVILDPNLPTPDHISAVTCDLCPRPFTNRTDLAEHKRYAHPEPIRPADPEGKTALVLGDGTGPAYGAILSYVTSPAASTEPTE